MDRIPRCARWLAFVGLAGCSIAIDQSGAALVDASPARDSSVKDASVVTPPTSDASSPDARIPFNFGAACVPELDAGADADAGDGGDANTCVGFQGARCFALPDGGGVCSAPCSDQDWQIECNVQLRGSCANGAFCQP